MDYTNKVEMRENFLQTDFKIKQKNAGKRMPQHIALNPIW